MTSNEMRCPHQNRGVFYDDAIVKLKSAVDKKFFLHDYVGTMTQLFTKKKISLHNPFKKCFDENYRRYVAK